MVLHVLERWEVTGLLAFTMCYGPRVMDLCYTFFGLQWFVLRRVVDILISWLVQRGDLLDIKMLLYGLHFLCA